jgi:hypothetical protein
MTWDFERDFTVLTKELKHMGTYVTSVYWNEFTLISKVPKNGFSAVSNIKIEFNQKSS